MSYTLGNLVSSIKNASMAGIEKVEAPYSVQSEKVLKVLEDHGFVSGVRVFKQQSNPFKKLSFSVAYEDSGLPKFTELKLISKPGLRKYIKHRDIQPVIGGRGILVVSTSRGILSGKEAKRKKLGGEALFYAL